MEVIDKFHFHPSVLNLLSNLYFSLRVIYTHLIGQFASAGYTFYVWHYSYFVLTMYHCSTALTSFLKRGGWIHSEVSSWSVSNLQMEHTRQLPFLLTTSPWGCCRFVNNLSSVEKGNGLDHEAPMNKMQMSWSCTIVEKSYLKICMWHEIHGEAGLSWINFTKFPIISFPYLFLDSKSNGLDQKFGKTGITSLFSQSCRS